jgi:fructokinase
MHGAHQDNPEIFLYSLFAYGRRGDRYQIVTRGPDGCEVYSEAETIQEPAVPARVVDTVGAGDAFTAAMVCLHLEGRPLTECARFANHYAARVCEHHGATPRIDRREVEATAFGT